MRRRHHDGDHNGMDWDIHPRKSTRPRARGRMVVQRRWWSGGGVLVLVLLVLLPPSRPS